MTVFGGLAVLLLLRLVERPLFGQRRPITPWITRCVCMSAFLWLGMTRRVTGTPMTEHGAGVANHASWLDIFALNASDRIYFVAKSEVASWPAIGWLARATGTIFIARNRSKARTHADLLAERLSYGHRLLFFPEGTSSDGVRVLPFKPTLFAPFFAQDAAAMTHVQPITLRYHPPSGAEPRFYGWWGDMDFGSSLLKMLAARRHGGVDVIYHAPLRVSDFPDRKALALACEIRVRRGLTD